MAQFVVRNIEEEVKKRLHQRAARHGRSMEAEVRDILCNAVKRDHEPTDGLGTEIAELFAGIGLRKEEEIQELRGFAVQDPFKG